MHSLYLPATLLLLIVGPLFAVEGPFSIPDTGQDCCYDNRRVIKWPMDGKSFSGQDAQYRGKGPMYIDNNDGTVTDKKVARGGSWADRPITAGSSIRMPYESYQTVYNVGFRVIIE